MNGGETAAAAEVADLAVAEPVCGARTRRGGWCRQRPVAGKIRCRMHGGAPGSGAPKGNRNAQKHGGYAREIMALRADASAMIRQVKRTIEALKRARARSY